MTQQWSLEPEDIQDATFLLNCLEPVGQHILGWLADRPGEASRHEHLTTTFSEELEQSQPRRTVREHIDRANRISISFGRSRLVDVHDDTCVISESGALILRPALDHLAKSAEIQRNRTHPK